MQKPKKFNTTGICIAAKHYMVNTEAKLTAIMRMIHDGCYFTINRARQYGKTTTLFMLQQILQTMPDEYTCIRISFEGVGDAMFGSEEGFCRHLLLIMARTIERTSEAAASRWRNDSVINFSQLNDHLETVCKDHKYILMIDEVDATSNNRIFLQFLAMLRAKFLERDTGGAYTFHSVVLAGVTDIKNIKLKLIKEGLHTRGPDESRQYNSPWNIAASFTVDMAFNPQEIATMLIDYEADHHTGMDTAVIAQEIFDYTSGYPFLVSRVCQCIDERSDCDWTPLGVRNAIGVLMREKNLLFDDMAKNLDAHREAYDFMHGLIILGEKTRFSVADSAVELCNMYGFTMVDAQGSVVVANKIFEAFLTEYFIARGKAAKRVIVCGGLVREIIRDGQFDMEMCLRRFAELYYELYTPEDMPFLEKHGRLLFLTYLKPLINSLGFFHIESQLADRRRMDVVLNYGREQFVVELKIWRGPRVQEKSYEQLLGYMDAKRLQCGYLLTFDFRTGMNKTFTEQWVSFGDRKIFEVVL